MTNNDPAARKARDIAAYKANAKTVRARLRREFRRLQATDSEFMTRDINTDPVQARLRELIQMKEIANAELRNVRDLPLSYYE